MAIIRKKRFDASGEVRVDTIALIDTPEKLVGFAITQGLESCPLDVRGVAEKFNIEVEYVPMSPDDDLSGVLFKDEDKDTWAILVNEKHHPNRQRYTIAHELGHFCLHRHLHKRFEDQIFFRGEESNKEEWQTNDFASSILIPEDEFRKFIRSGKRSIEELAKKFKVSTLALRIRAKNLGMSGHGL